MYGSLDISTSGLVAQRMRMDVISANIANKDVVLNADGEYEPYRRRIPMLAEGDPTSGNAQGVHVAAILEDQSAFMMRLEPDSPYADEDGYVQYPNIHLATETMNAMEASRSYEANIAAIEATKSMIGLTLELLT